MTKVHTKEFITGKKSCNDKKRGPFDLFILH